MGKSPIRITPRQLMAQWKGAAHKLQVNTQNFKVNVADEMVEIFQGSFDRHGFNTKPFKGWAQWQGNYQGRGSLMDETGTLKNSIKVKKPVVGKSVTVFTDPKAFSNTKRHKGFVYAGVHNDLHKVPRPERGPKKRRQFIGHSAYIKEKIKELEVKVLFKGLPL